MNVSKVLSIYFKLAKQAYDRDKDTLAPTRMATRYIEEACQALLRHPQATSVDEKTTFYQSALDYCIAIKALEYKNELSSRYFDHIASIPNGMAWAMQLRFTAASELVASGDLEAGEAAYKEASDLIVTMPEAANLPISYDILIRYGNMLFDRGAYIEAESYLKKAVELKS